MVVDEEYRTRSFVSPESIDATRRVLDDAGKPWPTGDRIKSHRHRRITTVSRCHLLLVTCHLTTLALDIHQVAMLAD